MPARLPFSTLIKPTGAACNLNCEYCFFLSKELLHPGSLQRMSDADLELVLGRHLNAQPDGEVVVGWQGGEPTLRGLDFFRHAVEIAERLKRPTQHVRHSMQTNATLLDDEWAEFLAEHEFLVGVSIDGPAELHDRYRKNLAERGTHDMVTRGWRVLQKHGVDVNVLCTVNSANAAHPLEVYRHFRDDLGAQFLQFIPIVERVPAPQLPIAESGWRAEDGERLLYRQTGDAVTSRSVRPREWGSFMSTIFDEWLAHDVGTIFVQHFDVALGNYLGQYGLCVHSPVCGLAVAVEFNGDVYSCDHFVEPGYELGNLRDLGFQEMLRLPKQVKFGHDKYDTLTAQCRRCPVRWACHGGCPKDRFATSVDGEPGQNYLCEGYQAFFGHITGPIDAMAQAIRQGRPAASAVTPGGLD